MKKNKLFSFDVFDTCLARLCGEPRNLFEVLSLKLYNPEEREGIETLRQMFVTARMKTTGKDLEDIYYNISLTLHLPFTIAEMVRIELETEREMLVPIINTLQLVNGLRKCGEIMFITDMYLPESFIIDILQQYGFYHEGDALYVSESVGASKRSGDLFRLIHSQLGIPYKNWHHYGDNKHGDYQIPNKLGIHAHLITSENMPYEQQWKCYPTVHYPIGSILSGISSSINASHDFPNDLMSFVCGFSAPLMVSWVVSILEYSLNQGITRIYFCARDTHSQFLIAKTLARCNKKYHNLDIRYLFISTQAINDKLCLEYLIQEGVASTNESVAIVDSRGRGFFSNNINILLSRNGYRKAYLFMLQLCVTEEYDQISIAGNNRMVVLHNVAYTKTLQNKVNAIEDIGWMIENLLSLNYHCKTIGYEIMGGRIRPLFSNESPEIEASNLRKLKKYQDSLLQEYATAYSTCGLTMFNDSIIPTLIIPTVSSIATHPPKQLLSYLTRFSIYGKRNRYVHNLFHFMKTKGGHWTNGCIYYTFPYSIARYVVMAERIIRKVTRKCPAFQS